MPFDASEDVEVRLSHNKDLEVDVSKCNPVRHNAKTNSSRFIASMLLEVVLYNVDKWLLESK